MGNPAPATPIGPAVGRAVQLIAQEAVHNACKHARAGRVEIGLELLGRRRCRLWVEDDGVGLNAAAPAPAARARVDAEDRRVLRQPRGTRRAQVG